MNIIRASEQWHQTGYSYGIGGTQFIADTQPWGLTCPVPTPPLNPFRHFRVPVGDGEARRKGGVGGWAGCIKVNQPASCPSHNVR